MPKYRIIALMVLFALSTAMMGAYAQVPEVSITFKQLQDDGLVVASGKNVTIQGDPNYLPLWTVTWENDSVIKAIQASSITFQAPPFDPLASNAILKVNMSTFAMIGNTGFGCIRSDFADITLVHPPEFIVYCNETYPVNLRCGITGANVVGPLNTSETYKYVAGISNGGMFAYNWSISDVTKVSEQDQPSVSDFIVDWTEYSSNASYDGTLETVDLKVAENLANVLPPKVVNPTLGPISCNIDVMVYPALNFSIGGLPPYVCDGSTNVTMTYNTTIGTNAGLAFSWKVNNVQVGTTDPITIDFSNRTIVPDYGDVSITLDVIRITPEGLRIDGTSTSIVPYGPLPPAPS